MVYLAILLGNGALEVREVTLPQTVKRVYPPSQERIDPRFMKLRPVFRCSMLNSGDQKSIPLTLEWSVASPHDMILAGCHDGLVVLWKFSTTGSSTETRPLLSFSADTGPIRSLAWAPLAPIESDPDGANIIVTGGHKGFKFWDIRDSSRHLWEHAIQGVNNSLDWLPNPRCIFGTVDDGTMWLLSLMKPSSDIPTTGRSSAKHGLHTFNCSSFSLWSVQASPLTGMVAYCGEDGTVYCFQLEHRSVSDTRNRLTHCHCGSLREEESTLIVVSPLPSDPSSKKTPTMKRESATATNKETPLSKGEASKELMEAAIEVFPPKIVAMHKVRWNVNQGTEKWLCSGGAAGLMRCQEVDLSVFQ